MVEANHVGIVNRKKDWLLHFFILLYPILPVYASIAGINARNLLCFIFCSITLVIKSQSKKIRVKGIQFALITFLVWIGGRMLQITASVSILEAVYFLLLTGVSFYCISLHIRSQEDFLRCLKWLLYGAYIVSLLGVIEEITHTNVFLFLNIEGYEVHYNPLRFGILRIIGFSQHTIVHGVYIMFCLSLCLYMWQFVNRRRQDRFFIVSLYILLWINLALTLSRSIIICTIATQILILYLLGVKKFFRITAKVLIIVIPALLVVSFAVPAVGRFIRYGFLMIAALFDDNSASAISALFGNDNLKGVGNRVDLYRWVIEKMPGYWFFGRGTNAEFSHAFTQSNGVYSWTVTKESIEVQYLSTLYQYGLFGMVTEVLTFISLLVTCIKHRFQKKIWERKLGFNHIAFATFVGYFVELFAVNQTSDRYIFYMFVALVLVYNNKLRNVPINDYKNIHIRLV